MKQCSAALKKAYYPRLLDLFSFLFYFGNIYQDSTCIHGLACPHNWQIPSNFTGCLLINGRHEGRCVVKDPPSKVPEAIISCRPSLNAPLPSSYKVQIKFILHPSGGWWIVCVILYLEFAGMPRREPPACMQGSVWWVAPSVSFPPKLALAGRHHLAQVIPGILNPDGPVGGASSAD